MNDHPQTHDDGLSPAARAALAALRAEDDLAAEVRARMWSRLAAAAEEDVLPDMSQQSAPRASGRGRGLLLGLAIAAGLTIAVLGLQRGAQPVAVAPRADAAAYGGPGAAQRSAHAASGEAAAPAADAAITAASGSPVPGDSSASGVQDSEPRSEPTPRRKPVDRAAVLEDMPAASASALAAEAALLQRVQTALATGAPAAALLQLEQHAREFPAGVLVQEREALRVVALCAAGREAEGRAEAATFLRAHAGSVLAERVRGACDEG